MKIAEQQAVVEVEALLYRGRPEVVDADLADYFGSIAHAELLKTAKALGLTIPLNLLAIADEVIE